MLKSDSIIRSRSRLTKALDYAFGYRGFIGRPEVFTKLFLKVKISFEHFDKGFVLIVMFFSILFIVFIEVLL